MNLVEFIPQIISLRCPWLSSFAIRQIIQIGV
jgi:hypothetical protein